MSSPLDFKVPSVQSSLEDTSEVTDQLEYLDDIIFPAIAGDETALDEAGTAWKTALASLGSEAVQETRWEYLRHARSTWDFLCRQSIYQPERILAVAKIILLLTSDDGG
ncbi:hypothetical protein [Bythopirellula polymerisocia]|uniref:ImpA N-terminal domain-containing protein n=1 Tax=Bythopirellula polymerisocia TaxID=2528003 RepID=A0A5C6CZG3_9BACT|nr:hypothetical protein [Bythopirellula polymerisocia]TWU30273.1 hypothetical protein Pla144_10590 [Bythopirellula polymerisocia]